ncbi:uncharacterized protein LOC127595986 [Hippocampus zosterae]|uniref:uncharacterized protein LOC127595986 n=1 Tax=Hippocampus zosterae TaxID=109293 RepID=UPI00223C9B8F|nr:uncharacterized protein LOC127595986 [Hippocampus zosterae]
MCISSKMYACCVLGCPNSHSSGGKLKFFRLPTEYRPFQANRRRLWLKVLRQVNGSAEELKENARICGAHFISGQASMDQDNPDFVPSVFANMKNSPRPKYQSRRIVRGSRKCKWPHSKNKDTKEEFKEAPTNDEEPAVQQPSMEMTQSQASQEAQTAACAKTEDTSTKDTEMKETPSASFEKTPPPFLKLGKTSPVVLLKHIVAPSGAYLCELCSENFSTIAQLVKHKLQHEGQRSPSAGDAQEKIPAGVLVECDEPTFPCNICDRVFGDRHHLKRHKLLHVRDVRKCQTCGVLFCQLHRRALLVAHPVIASESDDVCPVTESDCELEPGEVVEQLEDFHTSWAFIPMLRDSVDQNREPQASASGTEQQLLPEMAPPPSVPIRHEAKPSDVTAPEPQKVEKSEVVMHAPPKLPPALRMFSPQCLTSAFFEVQRNYEYILSNGNNVSNEIDVKKEPPETFPDSASDVSNEEPEVKEPTAYDLQIVL